MKEVHVFTDHFDAVRAKINTTKKISSFILNRILKDVVLF